MHPVKPSQPINELEQIVVEVPNRYNGMDHIIIVREAETGLHVIGDGFHDVPIHTYSSPAVTMCSYRAALTVRGNLLLNGAKIKPEDYVKFWRSVVPTTLEELADRYGIRLIANLKLDLAAEHEVAWMGKGEDVSKITTFNQFLASYPVDASGCGSMRLDSRMAFADLKTFHMKRAREKHGNYDPKSSISFVAQQVEVSAQSESKDLHTDQQFELI